MRRRTAAGTGGLRHRHRHPAGRPADLLKSFFAPECLFGAKSQAPDWAFRIFVQQIVRMHGPNWKRTEARRAYRGKRTDKRAKIGNVIRICNPTQAQSTVRSQKIRIVFHLCPSVVLTFFPWFRFFGAFAFSRSDCLSVVLKEISDAIKGRPEEAMPDFLQRLIGTANTIAPVRQPSGHYPLKPVAARSATPFDFPLLGAKESVPPAARVSRKLAVRPPRRKAVRHAGNRHLRRSSSSACTHADLTPLDLRKVLHRR